MKKVKLVFLALVASSSIFVSCNNEGKGKNEIKTQGSKKDAALSSTITNKTTTYRTDQLPRGVKEFIEKNYPGYAIGKAISDPLCQGGDAIDVAITKAGAHNLSLIFKTDGSFVQKEEDVPLSTASDKIHNALKTKFAGYAAGNQIEKLILANKSVQYLVDLRKGNTSKEVIFTAEGAVVCEN